MKLADAQRFINNLEKAKKGFRVAFEVVEGSILGSILRSDFTPADGEAPFKNEWEAWEFANRLAAATQGRLVNLHVVYAADYRPVEDFMAKMIRNRPDPGRDVVDTATVDRDTERR